MAKKYLKSLKIKKIICSGTIWGTVDKFFELAKTIWKEVEKKSFYKYSIHDQTAEAYLNIYDCKNNYEINNILLGEFNNK